jgi:hypothetical protein
MNRDDIIRMAREAGGDDWGIFRDFMPEIERFANLVAAAERQSVLVTIDELRGMESDRNAMFSDGYDHALSHIEEFIRARGQE